MSSTGHERLANMYTDKLKKRIGDTWAQMMNCQDGDNYDTTSTPQYLKIDPKDHAYIKLMEKYLPRKSIKILEIGAGDGAETRMFMDYGYKNITGITVGRENCSRGKELYNVDLQFMDMHFTSFPNQSFDAIIGFQTYEHTPSPLLLGLEFNRLLVPGGKVLMQVPYGETHFPFDQNPHHLNVVESWVTKNMLRKAGFENIVVERIMCPNNTSLDTFFAEKVGQGVHNNHFDDIVSGKFIN